jgi:Uncharacterized metal-binding protein
MMDISQKIKLSFPGTGTEITAEKDETLLDAARRGNIQIPAACSGKGICGKCKVRILKGSGGEITEDEKRMLTAEEMAAGIRLACCIRLSADIEAELLTYDSAAANKKTEVIMPDDFRPEPADAEELGAAFDIGTTTVVGMVWDLHTGKLAGVAAKVNYQNIFGADVISRIQYVGGNQTHALEMQQKVISCMNDILDEISKTGSVDTGRIMKVRIDGNTTMTHLVLKVSPYTLSRYPFEPVFTGMQTAKAADLGLHVNDDADIRTLPLIAGHVGSDITAMEAAIDIEKLPGCTVALDIGTNGEVVAGKDGQLVTCSTAAGPAFEGATIKCGMRAASGAIEAVSITKDHLLVYTIENEKAVGICGSGLIDCIAQLLSSGLLNFKGKLCTRQEALDNGINPEVADHLQGGEDGMQIELADGVILTQKDIREVQLAKGAILAGTQTLMKELGFTEKDIDRIIIAGAFGSYIRKESALAIGLIPEVPAEKIISAGNAAGTGVCMALLSQSVQDRIVHLAGVTRHIELSKNMDFQNYYMEAMFYPRRWDAHER